MPLDSKLIPQVISFHSIVMGKTLKLFCETLFPWFAFDPRCSSKKMKISSMHNICFEQEKVTDYPEFLFLTITNTHANTSLQKLHLTICWKALPVLPFPKENECVFNRSLFGWMTHYMTISRYLLKSDRSTTVPPYLGTSQKVTGPQQCHLVALT